MMIELSAWTIMNNLRRCVGLLNDKESCMRYYIFPALIAVLSISGCASGPKVRGLSAEVLDTIRSEGLDIKPFPAADFRSQTKGKVVALSAVSIAAAAFGGGQVQLHQRNRMPPSGYLDIDSWSLAGRVAEAGEFKDPTKAMESSVRERLLKKGIVHNSDASYSLSGWADFWGIDYEKLTEADNYRLYFNLKLFLKSGISFQRSVICAGASLEKHSYDDWMAGDRERIHRAAAVIGDSCASRLLAELDLAGGEALPLAADGEM
jgi:hypothetical protein